MGLSIFADPSPDVTPLPIETVLLHLKPFDEDAALKKNSYIFDYYYYYVPQTFDKDAGLRCANLCHIVVNGCHIVVNVLLSLLCYWHS